MSQKYIVYDGEWQKKFITKREKLIGHIALLMVGIVTDPMLCFNCH